MVKRTGSKLLRFLRTGALAAPLLAGVLSAPALAQTVGSLHPKPLPPLANPDDPSLPAKQLFGRATSPVNWQARSIGFYSRGCLAGGQALPVDGSAWQVMRLSRNRNWANPAMIAFLEDFARKVPHVSHWPGILVGDMSQPRGGPMITGHASHQIGLDADIWLTPMPNHRLSREEREQMSAVDMVRRDRMDINPEVWTPDQMAVIRAAAKDPRVQRIFVNPAIKKALCRDAGADRDWLRNVRPMYGHNYHFHVRLFCPRGQEGCSAQDDTAPGDGCGADLARWFTDAMMHPKPTHRKPRPPITLDGLPAECRMVLKD
ncbi:MAG: penicillin-insensitive murein endopeptidase [Hyphomicrobiales bacterium]|nr:penicillin-insensitive murein endopeptidase [Hyphomicrobiales bacterium]